MLNGTTANTEHRNCRQVEVYLLPEFLDAFNHARLVKCPQSEVTLHTIWGDKKSMIGGLITLSG